MSLTLQTERSETIREQRFIQTGVSWEAFKFIQKGFENSPNVRLFYYLGELEVLATSPEHEIVKGNIGFLLEDYLLSQDIDFIGTGSFSQEKEGEAAVQADESYCFGQKKALPDLAIEVVLTSGGLDKLRRYKRLGVREVWFWENNALSMYALEGDSETGEYRKLQQSQFVPNLDCSKLARCAAIASRVQAVKAFRSGESDRESGNSRL
jgi:Uma2 family endonuclease